MAVWTEDEFVSRAKTLAKAHVGSKTPLNDLVEKVARENEMTPDAIRTLGRLTNVAVFQEMFQQKAASAETDRMVEFEPGDPEIVISRVVKSAAVDPVAPPLEGDKTASLLPDMMQEVRLGQSFDVSEKVAAAEASEREAPRPLQVMRYRKLADELEVEAHKLAAAWDVNVASLTRTFKRAPGYGPTFVDFEKAAFSEHGRSARPEMEVLREELRMPPAPITVEKIAELTEKYAHENSPELELLGRTIRIREQYQTVKVAQQRVADQLASL